MKNSILSLAAGIFFLCTLLTFEVQAAVSLQTGDRQIAPISQLSLQPTAVGELIDSHVSTLSAFREVLTIPDLNIETPTVVEVSFPNEVGDNIMVVLDQNSGELVPNTTSIESSPVKYRVATSSGVNQYFTDNNLGSYVDLLLENDGLPTIAKIYVSFDEASLVSGLTFSFDELSQQPEQISIMSGDGQAPGQILLSKTAFISEAIRFPENRVRSMVIELDYSQPIRINELYVQQSLPQFSQHTKLRFLAKHGGSYQIFVNPDRSVTVETAPAGQLFLERQPITYLGGALTKQKNKYYLPADSDDDGVIDESDNCPSIANPDQKDRNGDGVGDACEDTDYDGVINLQDNCMEHANPNQQDTDGDGSGDVCDKEESRFTEKYPWLSWVAIVGTGLVIVVLVALMLKNADFKNLADKNYSPLDDSQDQTPFPKK